MDTTIAPKAILQNLASGDIEIFDLEQERFAGAPSAVVQAPAFHYALNRRHAPNSEGRTSAAGLVLAVEHFGTHVDALCHQAFNGMMFQGVSVAEAQSDAGFSQYGAETIAPMVRRGVLIDVSAAPTPADGLFGVEVLRTAAERQGVEVARGDVVLVRTGAGRQWEAEPELYLQAPGIAASGSEWLASLAVSAVGADNMAWDSVTNVDGAAGDFPGHITLLVEHGIYIFENLNLESLAEAKVHEFLFIAAPLKLRGATGAPVRPIAIAHRRKI